MKKAKLTWIKYECRQFCAVFNIGEEKRIALEKLAIKDYNACNAKDRENWSLEMLTLRLRAA